MSMSICGVNSSIQVAGFVPGFISEFLCKHENDILSIYDIKEPIGDWKKLGNGVSKIAFTHQELPGYIMKIPRSNQSYWKNNDSDISAHVKNLQYAKSVINEKKYKHIVAPDAHLVEASDGPFVIETKFNFVDSDSVEDGEEKTEICNELWDFLYRSGFCDIRLFDYDEKYGSKNVGFLQSNSGEKKDLKIGIFDFDCKNKPFTLFKHLQESHAPSSNVQQPAPGPIGCASYFDDFEQ